MYKKKEVIIIGRKTIHNHIISEEKRKQFNEENVRLMEDFIVYLQSIGRSQGTIEGYRNDLEMIFAYNIDRNKNKCIVDWTKKDVMFFQNYFVNTLKLSGARYRRLRSALSSLSNYIELMEDETYPNFRNIVNKIEAPSKQPVREKSVWEEEQIQNLLDYLVKQEQYQRACLLALAMASGSRKSELLRFKVDYFNEGNIIYGSLYKTPEKIKTKGRDGGKMLNKYTLKSKFQPYLDLWIKQRKELGIDSEWLFVYKKDGQYVQMGVAQANYIANLFTKFLEKEFYFHSLRHLWCTSLVKSGLPESVIQSIGGWSSLEMVSIYNDTEVDDTLGQYFGEEGIKQVERKELKDL